MGSSKYTKLVKNTAIFAIGNFSTKILTFLIVPLYTYVLTTEEYGRIDLFTTTISFLVPIVTLQVQEALIRYLLGREIDEQTAVSNCWATYLCGSIISLCLFPYSLFESCWEKYSLYDKRNSWYNRAFIIKCSFLGCV